MAKTIRIAGKNFNANFFYTYMRKNFGESFAHSSLSFEKEFEESKKLTQRLNEFMSQSNCAYATKLENGSKEDLELLKTRYSEIAIVLERMYSIPKERYILDEDEEDYSLCIDDFIPYFKGAVRPYRNRYEIEQARLAGKLTDAPYENESLIDKVKELADLVSLKVAADKKAHNLKKGNNEAYAYSLGLESIGIPEIIKINAKVNKNSGIHTGFKTTDNDIINAPFQTCPKELVPIKMQELLYNYNYVWSQDIPPFTEDVDDEKQKIAHLRAICDREAKFHIAFERIHPFEDGNGRTGRIILNAHLVANELAPVLITPEMREFYIECIDTDNYQALSQHIMSISSVCLTEMVSQYRRTKGIDPDELRISDVQPKGHHTAVKVYIPKDQQEEPVQGDDDIKIYRIKR